MYGPSRGRTRRCVLAGLLVIAALGWVGEGTSVAAAPAELISVAPGVTTPLPTDDRSPSVSGDGNIVLFDSPDFSGSVFTEVLWVRNRAAHTTTLVPQPIFANPGTSDWGQMAGGKVSRDGCHVAFWGKWYFDFPAGQWDIYSWNRCVPGSTPIAVASNVLPDNAFAGTLAISADGRYIAYSSLSPFTTGVPHIARIDTSTLTESVLTVGFDRTESVDISDNGSFVTIAGRLGTDFSTEFVLGWSAPCTTTCTTEFVSVNNAGQKVSGFSTEASVSADGRYVAFTSDAPELGVPAGASTQMFVRDRVAKVTRLVTDTPGQPMPAGLGLGSPDISPDGSQIALTQTDSGETSEVWVARSTSGFFDTAVFDLVSFGVSGAPVTDGAGEPSMSSTGRFVAFTSSFGVSNAELSGGTVTTRGNDIWMRDRPIALDITPTLNFGDVDVGSQSPPLNAVLTNTSGVVINLSVITPPLAPFAITGNGCGGLLPAGGSCTITVVFKPTIVGGAASSITVSGDGLSVSVSLVGNGRALPTAGSLTIAPTAANFGTAQVGTALPARTFAVSNPGQTAVTFSAVSLNGVGADQFSIASNTCTGSLGPGANCAIVVSSTVTREGSMAATLVVLGTGGQSAQATLRVTGTNEVVVVFTPTLKMNPGVVSAGEVTVAIGAGFPPNIDVQLAFEGEAPFTTVHSDGDGAFRYDFLIFRNGIRIGGRQVVALDQAQFSGVRAPLLIDLATFRPAGFSSPAFTSGIRALVSRGG